MVFDLAAWWVHTVTVTTLSGQGAYGPEYAPTRTVPCLVEDEVKQVRDQLGNEVVSSSRVRADKTWEPLFTPGSRVTIGHEGLPDRQSTVITCNVFDTDRLGVNLSHIEVHLT